MTQPDRPASSATPTQITREMRDRLVRLAYRFVWNRADAEEIAQDALLRGHTSEKDLREPHRWWSWICRIVVRRCHEYGRQKVRWKRHETPYRETQERRATEAQPAGDDRKGIVRELLQELPPRRREVMVLRHLQGMDYGEIAEVLGISAATARVHAQAGREDLRRILTQTHPDWFSELE